MTLTTMSCLLGTLAALGLRLHWQAVRDGRRQETLTTLITRLPTNTHVEMDDVRDDGSRLHLRIVAPNLDQDRERDARS